MKKVIVGLIIAFLIAVCSVIGYNLGVGSQKQSIADSYTRGYLSGNNTGYKTAQDNILSSVPKDVSYEEVARFVADDRTDENEYDVDHFNCEDFSRIVRENAIRSGIRCGYVELTLNKGSHAVNVFNVTNGHLVYLEAQRDILIPSIYGEISVGRNFIDELNTISWISGRGFTSLDDRKRDDWIIKRINIIW